MNSEPTTKIIFDHLKHTQEIWDTERLGEQNTTTSQFDEGPNPY